MFYFPRNSISRLLRAFGLLFFAVLIGIAGTASAQDRRQNAPGEFDFYVLSLSWSPSFCKRRRTAAAAGAPRSRAGGGRIRSWCPAWGRNTGMAFREIVR